MLTILASLFILVETDRYIAVVPAEAIAIKPVPVEEPTMSNEWQAAVLEACDAWDALEPTGDMFNDWQTAVKEATE